MIYDPNRIKRQIQAEAELHDRFGPGKIWTFIVKEIFKNDTESAKKFMLSSAGGFEASEVERILQKNETYKSLYNKNLSTSVHI
jgi:hypothetical protein